MCLQTFYSYHMHTRGLCVGFCVYYWVLFPFLLIYHALCLSSYDCAWVFYELSLLYVVRNDEIKLSEYIYPNRWRFVINILRPRQYGDHLPDDIFKWIFLNWNVWISIKISLNCVPRSPINNIPALVQIMTWRRPGDKPLSEPMMVSLLTHICVTRPRWVNILRPEHY